ncbi:hypothetical protein [Enterococcus sp. AZ029]|uniref:hypothetical protein n=1 Tax=Enterococcus sp. AZ029 TaxID=2774841 RepID=UPI003F268F62
MNKQECQICEKNQYLQDELGGKWIIENKVLIIKQRFQDYAGSMWEEDTRSQKINYCPMCGRRLNGDSDE